MGLIKILHTLTVNQMLYCLNLITLGNPNTLEKKGLHALCDAPKSYKCMCTESHIRHILGQTGLY